MNVQTILLASAFVLVVSTVHCASVQGAEVTVQPAITVSEEYNDNLFLTTTDKRTDYITRIVSAITVTYKTPIWDWDVAYAYDYRYYANYKVDENLYTLNLNNHTRMLNDALLFDIQDVHTRTPLSVVRDWTQESLFLNQTDTNTLIATPYTKLRLAPNATLTTGYQYRNIWYQNPEAIDKADHGLFATFDHEVTSRLTMSADIRYTGTTAETDHLRRTDLLVSVVYAHAANSLSWYAIGNSWLDIDTEGESTQVVWNAGFLHTAGKYSYTINSKMTYMEDPLSILRREDQYVAAITRQTERTTLGLSAGWYEYRNAISKHLEDTRHLVTGTISQATSQTTKIIYDASVGRVEDNVQDQYTEVYLGGIRYEFMPSASLTIAMQYRYANAYSPDDYAANHHNNRVMVEIKKIF